MNLDLDVLELNYGNYCSADDDDEIIQAKCHYLKAEVDGSMIFELNDDAHVQVMP